MLLCKHNQCVDEEEKANDQLAMVRELFSYVPNIKTTIFIFLGLFCAMLSGVIFLLWQGYFPVVLLICRLKQVSWFECIHLFDASQF